MEPVISPIQWSRDLMLRENGEVAVNDSSQLNKAAVLRRSGEAMHEAPVMREAMKLRRCKILNKNGNI